LGGLRRSLAAGGGKGTAGTFLRHAVRRGRGGAFRGGLGRAAGEQQRRQQKGQGFFHRGSLLVPSFSLRRPSPPRSYTGQKNTGAPYPASGVLSYLLAGEYLPNLRFRRLD